MFHKYLPSFLGFCLTASVSGYDSRVTYHTPEEIQGFGDFNGDTFLDVVTVDRATGQFRIGQGQAEGSLVWQAARPSGCANTSDLAVGQVRSAGRLDLVFTSPFANQIFLIDPNAAFSRPEQVTPNGLGPTVISAVDLNQTGNDPTLDDLITFTAWNSPPNEDTLNLFLSLPGSIAVSGDVKTGDPIHHTARVLLKTGFAENFSTSQLVGGTTTFRILDSQIAGFPVKTSLAGLPADVDYVSAPFLGGANFQFLFFEPGTAGLLYSNSDPATGALSAVAARTVGLDPIRSVHVINDGTNFQFVVIYNDGEYANIYALNASGLPVLEGSLNPPAGKLLKGILGSSARNFHLLHGASGQSSSVSVHYSHSGSWTAQGATPMPGVGAAAGISNVFLYDKEPLVNPDAKLIETIQVPDWTSALVIDGGGNVSVMTETFSTPTGGLGGGSMVALGTKPTGATFGLTNQNFDEVALTSGEGNLGLIPVQISITPSAGTYSRYITPELTVPSTAGIDAYYRFDTSEAWTTFALGSDTITPPGNTLTPFSIFYYAEDTATGQRSPIYRADYSFSGEPGSLDSDGDGVPDHVELNAGLDPLLGADSDEDGLSDLDELLYGSDPTNGGEMANYGGNVLALPPSRTNDEDGDGFSDFTEWVGGSDPFDPASTPASDPLRELQNVFDLNLIPQSQSGNTGDRPDRNSYEVSHTTYSSTELRLHDLNGDLIHHTQTDNHAAAVFPNPYGEFLATPATGRDLFVIYSTPAAFDMDQDNGFPGWGRELIGLVPIPSLDLTPVSSPYGGADEATEAANWLAAAVAHYGVQTRTTVNAQGNFYDALALVLFERIVGDLLRDRGTLSSALPVSLTGFRDTIPPDGDADSQEVTMEQLLGLQTYVDAEDPGWLLQDLFQTLSDEARSGTELNALRKLANEIYRISASRTYTDPELLKGIDPALHPESDPGLFPSPYETLRSVVHSLPSVVGDVDGLIPLPGDSGDGPPTSYSAEHTLSVSDLQDADEALVSLLTLLSQRTTQTYSATVNATSFSSRVPLLNDGGTGLRLYDVNGDPFDFPQTFDLPVGTELEILAFDDRTNLPAGAGIGIEVISATITSFPAPIVTDENLNAIDDAFELYFLGGNTNPFDDADGDGFSNLQESLEGTHPANPASTPEAPPMPMEIPAVRISRSGDNLTFELEFPSLYGDQLYFLLQTQAGTLSSPFVESSDSATNEGANIYSLTLPAPAGKSFFRFRLALRP